MSLLAPWFLAGLALLAGPIIAHLIRRATRERVAFTAVRFLEESAPRLDRRSRVQHPWLLALRCLIVATLALGFARPYLRFAPDATATTRERRHVVAVLDESASMRRAGLWSAAHQRLRQVVSALAPEDRFVLLAAGLGITELINADTWSDAAPRDRARLLESVLSAREPGWGPTPLDSAVEAALARWEDLAEINETPARRELVIVSDFAAGSRLSGLASIDWPAGTQVTLESVQPTHSGNASTQWLGWAPAADGTPTARVRVSRTFDTRGPLYWRLHDAENDAPLGPRQALELLPGGSQVLTVPWPETASGPLRLELSGDDDDFDNRLWLVRPEARQIYVSYLGSHRADDPAQPLFYVSRALRGWQEPRAELQMGLPPAGAPAALIVVNQRLDAATTEAVRARVQAGAFAVVLAGTSDVLETAAALAGEPHWQPIPPQRDDALLGQLDFRHPLFAPFADPLYSDFTRIRFWRPQPFTLPLESAATVVARYDDGSAAVAEVAVGQGRVVVWGSDWAPNASQWVLSSKFVPWLQALAERAVGGARVPTMVELGSAGPLEVEGSRATPVTPGVYSITQHGGPRPVAFNVPASEIQIEPISLETWEQLGVPLASATSPDTRADVQQRQRRETAAALESRQQAWRWLLIAAAVLLVFEGAVAGQLSRGTPTGLERGRMTAQLASST